MADQDVVDVVAEEELLTPHPPQPAAESTWTHVAAGVGSRCTVELFMSPLHLVKVRVQAAQAAAAGAGLKGIAGPSVGAAMKEVFQQEGLRGMYRGLAPRLLWSAPLNSFMFVLYEHYRSLIQGQVSSHSWLAVGCGPLFLAFGTMVRTPFDIVEVTRQLGRPVAGTKLTDSAASQVSALIRTEGLRRAMTGASATYLMSSSFLCTYFGAYEGSKRMLNPYLPSMLNHLVSGGIAGCIGAVLATPFDTIKTHMQMTVAADASQHAGPVTFWRTVKMISETKGRAHFWRGVKPRVLAFTPGGAIALCSYEIYKDLIGFAMGSK